MPVLDLNCAGTVKLALGGQIGLVCKLWGVVEPKILCFFPYLYLRLPSRADLADSKKSALVIWSSDSLILKVLRPCNAAQIAQPVVSPISVDMVNIADRKCSIGVKPCKPVSPVGFMVYPDYSIPVGVRNASLLENATQEALHKHTSFWVVVKQFAQACCGKIGLSHDTVPSLIGQRPARVDSTGGLRHFITRTCSCAAEITQGLHQSALTAVSVCTPANHRRMFNHRGSLTPFNNRS